MFKLFLLILHSLIEFRSYLPYYSLEEASSGSKHVVYLSLVVERRVVVDGSMNGVLLVGVVVWGLTMVVSTIVMIVV